MPKNYPTEATIKSILKDKVITIDNGLMKKLGYDNTRDFFAALGNWGYNTDFNTIPASCDDLVQSFVRAFIRTFLD